MVYFDGASVFLSARHGLIVDAGQSLVPADSYLSAISQLQPHLRKARLVNALLACTFQVEKGATLRDLCVALEPFIDEVTDILDVPLDAYVLAARRPYSTPSEPRVLLVHPHVQVARDVAMEFAKENMTFMERLQSRPSGYTLKSHCSLTHNWTLSYLKQEDEHWNLYSVPISFKKIVDAQLWLNIMTTMDDTSDTFYQSTYPSLLNPDSFGMLAKVPLVRNAAMPIVDSRCSLREFLDTVFREIAHPEGSDEREEALIASLTAAMEEMEHISEDTPDTSKNVLQFPSAKTVEDAGNDEKSNVKVLVSPSLIDSSVVDYFSWHAQEMEKLEATLKTLAYTRIVGNYDTAPVKLLRVQDRMEPYQEEVLSTPSPNA